MKSGCADVWMKGGYTFAHLHKVSENLEGFLSLKVKEKNENILELSFQYLNICLHGFGFLFYFNGNASGNDVRSRAVITHSK